MAEDAQRLEEVIDEQRSLREKMAKLERERDEYHQLYLDMLERNRQLERGLLAPKTERLAPSEQLSMSMLGMMVSGVPALDDIEPETQEVKPHTRRKPTGRKPLPEHLPRREQVLLPPEVEKEGLDAFEKIGEETTEVLERRPSSAIVLRFIKPKFVRKDRPRRRDEGVRGRDTDAAHPARARRSRDARRRHREALG